MNRPLKCIFWILSLSVCTACSSAFVTSNPKNIYFAPNDTLVIAGLRNIKPSFHETAHKEIVQAFSNCRVARVIDYYQFQKLLATKAAIQDLNLDDAESFKILGKINMTGYIIEASVEDLNTENSLINYIPRDRNIPSSPDPWIKFHFRIYHVKTRAIALDTHIRVRVNSIVLGKSGDTDIGVNKGVDADQPAYPLRKALRKMKKVCHCR